LAGERGRRISSCGRIAWGNALLGFSSATAHQAISHAESPVPIGCMTPGWICELVAQLWIGPLQQCEQQSWNSVFRSSLLPTPASPSAITPPSFSVPLATRHYARFWFYHPLTEPGFHLTTFLVNRFIKVLSLSYNSSSLIFATAFLSGRFSDRGCTTAATLQKKKTPRPGTGPRRRRLPPQPYFSEVKQRI